VEELPREVNRIIVVEDPLFFGNDSHYPLYIHKQRLTLYRASMMRYVEEVLWPAGYQVDYVEHYHMSDSGDIVNKLIHASVVYFFELNDDVLYRRLHTAISELEHGPQSVQLDSPNFYLKRTEVQDFFARNKHASFEDFYLWQRERHDILIDHTTYQPEGGKLCHDVRQHTVPSRQSLPSFQVFGSNKYVEEARNYVYEHFPDNPGGMDDFPWPTSHLEAAQWLQEFVDTRLEHYGQYHDAIDADAPWLFHAAIAPMLNMGLLSPQQVVQTALERHKKRAAKIHDIEGFIRHILGSREFTRALYIKRHSDLRTSNKLSHNRRLTNDWYYGTTGIPPVDASIKKIIQRGYVHQAERRLIGNAMLMSDIHPDEVCRWFLEMLIDTYDWTLVPEIYGFSQFADLGNYTQMVRPSIYTSSYILDLSDYEKGEWCELWDGLYGRFIEKHR